MSRADGEKVLWLIAGLGIGAGVTFLFGTRAGRNYRRQIGRVVEEGCDQITEVGKDALEKGKELYESGREFVEETGKRVGARLHVAGK
ncbi:MAG: YtxH domain-containing protein [Acidobacteria bacterium]|nr:YtxH domain-containing protein [Acidobacteriota bacterium]